MRRDALSRGNQGEETHDVRSRISALFAASDIDLAIRGKTDQFGLKFVKP
jgi:predicted methyltransferase